MEDQHMEDQHMEDYHLMLLDVWVWQSMGSLLAPTAWVAMA